MFVSTKHCNTPFECLAATVSLYYLRCKRKQGNRSLDTKRQETGREIDLHIVVCFLHSADGSTWCHYNIGIILQHCSHYLTVAEPVGT